MFLVFAINCVSQALAWEAMKKPPTTLQHHIVAGVAVTLFIAWTLVLSALAIAMSMTQVFPVLYRSLQAIFNPEFKAKVIGRKPLS